MSEWQAYVDRERRRERRRRILGWIAMVAAAVGIAVGTWLALVGFLIVFGVK